MGNESQADREEGDLKRLKAAALLCTRTAATLTREPLSVPDDTIKAATILLAALAEKGGVSVAEIVLSTQGAVQCRSEEG